MARYSGPRLKVCRQLGVVLPGLTSKTTLIRPFPPGQHGARRRAKMSDYKMRLIEKQKLRYHFGILERQFKRYVRGDDTEWLYRFNDESILVVHFAGGKVRSFEWRDAGFSDSGC